MSFTQVDPFPRLQPITNVATSIPRIERKARGITAIEDSD